MDTDHDVQQAVARGKPARMPPRSFVLLFWHAHRTLLRLSRDGEAREDYGFDRMAQALGALHRQLKPADT